MKRPYLGLRRWSLLLLFTFQLEKLLNLRALSVGHTSLMSLEALTALFLLLQVSLAVAFFTTRRRYVLLPLGLFVLCYDFTSFSHDGADAFAFHLLLVTAIFPTRSPESQDLPYFLGLLLALGQVVIIYLYNFSAKLVDPLWQSGDALGAFLHNAGVSLGPLSHWSGELSLKLLTWGVVLLQLAVLLEIPLKTRKVLSGLFIVKHMTIAALLHPYFGLICATIHAYIFFCPTDLREGLRLHWQASRTSG